MAEIITAVLTFLSDIGTWVIKNLWIFPVGGLLIFIGSKRRGK